MHFLSHSVATAFRLDDRLVKKVREIIDVPVGEQNHVAAASAIAAIRSTFRHIFLAPEADAAAPAAAGLSKDFDAIDKHDFGFR